MHHPKIVKLAVFNLNPKIAADKELNYSFHYKILKAINPKTQINLKKRIVQYTCKHKQYHWTQQKYALF